MTWSRLSVLWRKPYVTSVHTWPALMPMGVRPKVHSIPIGNPRANTVCTTYAAATEQMSHVRTLVLRFS